MARSTYVYVVQSITTRAPLATFTVKHECASFLRRRLTPDARYEVYRFLDNPPDETGSDVVLLGTVAEFLENNP